jgi:PAS domain-containing protein
MSDKDPSRRWTIAITQLRTRAARARRGGAPSEASELIDEALALCEVVVRDLAGAGLRIEVAKEKLEAQAGLWSRLFEEMPGPCVETDGGGVILSANPAAAALLNTSVRHLPSRLLLHFADDRDQFGQLLRGLSAGSGQHRCALVVRPRERAPLRVLANVVVRSPGNLESWLWFLTPIDSPRPATRPERRIPQTVINAAMTG